MLFDDFGFGWLFGGRPEQQSGRRVNFGTGRPRRDRQKNKAQRRARRAGRR